jgi:TPR repeat protein
VLAFIGYKYWRGELNFEGFGIGGFSLGSADQAEADIQVSAIAASGTPIVMQVVGDPLMGTDEVSQGEPALEPISPDGTIAFSAPESIFGQFSPDGTIAGIIASALKHLPDPATLAERAGQMSTGGEDADTVDHTASLSHLQTEAEEPAAVQKDDPASRARDRISAALAGAKVRSAALPSSDVQSSVLPARIGSAGLRQAALAGIPEAQFEIASRFADGSNVRRDLSTAAVWYEKAAAKGLAPAQFRLGSMYDKANGVPRDRQRAARLYLSAAEAGNAKAMHNLAVLYAEGGTGEPDLPNAARWFLKAARHGVRDSQFNIGILYARGLGLPKNNTEAYKWFAIAAKSGDDQAAKRRDVTAASMSQDELSAAGSQSGYRTARRMGVGSGRCDAGRRGADQPDPDSAQAARFRSGTGRRSHGEQDGRCDRGIPGRDRTAANRPAGSGNPVGA